MRALLALAALALALAGAAQAQLPSGLTSNVQFVKNFLRHTDTSGARLVDGYYYVTTERDLSIYDVKNPESPTLVGNTLLAVPSEPTVPEEDPDTNGRLLIVSNTDTLVYDVSDKTHPNLIGRLAGVDQHTMSCVLDCTWVYGSGGAIIDLRDPTKPKLAGQWNEGQGFPTLDSTHDVTEVAPGIVVTSSQPMLVLDARADPAHPVLLKTGRTPGFMHGNLWPGAGTDNFLLAGGEALGPGCANSADATFMTLDARNWQTAGFRLLDQYRLNTGVVVNGSNVDSTWCTHWFGVHPRFANGGLVGIAWYEQGVRFLKVDAAGKIAEVGYWLPVDGQASDVEWVSDRILYVADYLRGVDILRFTGDIPPSFPGASPPATAGAKATVSFDRLVTMPRTRRCVRARTFRVRVRKRRSDPVTWARLRIDGHRVATARGAALRRGLRARRLPRGRFSAQVEVRTRSGAKSAGQRTYRRC